MRGYIPRKYEAARIEDFPDDIQDDLREVLNTDGGLIVEGPNGVGKTHAVVAVAHEQWLEGLIVKPPVYVPAAMIHDLWNDMDTWRDQPWVLTLKQTRLLILDDLGKENRSTDYRQDIAAQRIGELLRFRVQENKPTYITTNVSAEKLREVYGESIVSLLHELAMVWIEMSGKDRRR